VPDEETHVNTCLFVVLAVVGQSSDSAREPREIHVIRREVSDLLRAESNAATDAERGRTVRRLAEVYLEIVGDERFTSHPTLQQQRNKVWTRLTRIRDELKRRRGSEARTPREPSPDDEQGQHELAGSLAAHLHLASQTMGGPSAVFAEAAGGGAIVDDYSEELIDLITNTINPSHWNINGGPGSIAYYRPAMALVVRASSEVQGRVGDVVGGLRDAGR
jgi:hypothetical protein